MCKHGPDRVISTHLRYAPPNINALKAILADDERQEEWRRYVADMVCIVAKRLSGKKFNPPLYSDLVGTNLVRTDSRSGQEIVDSIAAKIRRKRAARGGA